MVNVKPDNDDRFVPVTSKRGVRIASAQSDYHVAVMFVHDMNANTNHDANPFAILETTLVDDDCPDELCNASFSIANRKPKTKPVVAKDSPRTWHPDEMDHGTLDYLLKGYVSTRESSLESLIEMSLPKIPGVASAHEYVLRSHSIW
jgi:hypothetical protein